VIARFDAPARQNLGAAGLTWFLLLAGAVTSLWVFAPTRRDALDSDLTLVFIGAQLRPGAPFGQ
jgi:hypothetical protein